MIINNLVTIITPFFNSYEYFNETFESVMAQTYENFEWLIVDNGSEPEQLTKLKLLTSNDDRVSVFSTGSNCGAGPARNVGLDNAKGVYIAFIDSDDLWDCDFLESMIAILDNSSVDIVYGGYRRLYSGGATDIYMPKLINDCSNILRGCDISCLSTLIKVKDEGVKARFGSLMARNDLVFFFSLLMSYNAYPVPVIKSTYRILENSLSRNKVRALKFQWKVNRIYAKNNLLLSSFNCFIWMLRGLNKYKRLF